MEPVAKLCRVNTMRKIGFVAYFPYCLVLDICYFLGTIFFNVAIMEGKVLVMQGFCDTMQGQ